MPTLRLSRGPRTPRERATPRPRTARRHPPCVLIGMDSGRRVQLPFGPTGGNRGGFAREFEQRGRTGRTPLLNPVGDQLPTLSWAFLLADRDYQVAVTSYVNDLRELVRSGERINVSFGAGDGGIFRCTAYDEDVQARQHGSNDDTRTVITMTLTHASDALVRIGPLSGGAVQPPKAAAPKTSGGGRAVQRRYTVVARDTLSKIAHRFYGTPNWHPIARANKLVNPNLIRPGQVLIIPPKP